MKVDAHGQQADHEAVSLDQRAASDLEAGMSSRFTSHGAVPPVSEEMPHPVQPSPSDRAFNDGHAHGTDKGMLAATQRRVVDGVTIVAPPGVHADAIDRAAEFIRQELGKNEYAQHGMAAARAEIVIIPAHARMTDLPEFASLRGTTTFDGRHWENVRGSGGKFAPDGALAIGVAEENLRAVKDVVSTYPTGYSIGMHELAHAVEMKGLTPDQKQRLDALFAQQAGADPGDRKDTFTDHYAASNVHEYFAQCTNAFFGKNASSEGKKANHNGRDWLRAHDPDMYAFLVELYETRHDASGQRVP